MHDAIVTADVMKGRKNLENIIGNGWKSIDR